MRPQVIIAAGLGMLLAAAFLFSRSVNTTVLTPLPSSGFAAGFVLLAALAGFIGYTFSSPLGNRLARRIVMLGCLGLGLFAGGSAWRALAIRRAFAHPLPVHDAALPIVSVDGGAIRLRSPFTGTVFAVPTTIAARGGFGSFALAGRCARVQVEETARGDVRIVRGESPVTDADVVPCPMK